MLLGSFLRAFGKSRVYFTSALSIYPLNANISMSISNNVKKFTKVSKITFKIIHISTYECHRNSPYKLNKIVQKVSKLNFIYDIT